MKITCPKCGFSGNISDKLVPDEGRKVGCPKCKEKFFIKKPIVLETVPNEAFEIERNTYEPPTQQSPPSSEANLSDMFWGRYPKKEVTPSQTSVSNRLPERPVEVLPPDHGPNVAICPRCGSTSVALATKGFGGGKAGCGCCLLGPIGLLAGMFGSGKTETVCMNCGHKWRH